MPNQGQGPQGPQKTIKATMHLATFVGDISSETKLQEFNKSVEEFLATIDNVKRLINGRNAYAIGDKYTCIQIWYLETIQPDPTVGPLGRKDEKEEKS